MKVILTACTLLFHIVLFAQTDSIPHQADPKAKAEAKKQLEAIRQDILAEKKDFATAAIIYSMDPGSSMTGGLYKNIPRGTFVPEFEAVAFSIKVGEVSEIFETQFGYHILLVEARRGDEIDVRHILITPK
jgi:peptidyl-prolyl cis-trans isomerase SurA